MLDLIRLIQRLRKFNVPLASGLAVGLYILMKGLNWQGKYENMRRMKRIESKVDQLLNK